MNKKNKKNKKTKTKSKDTKSKINLKNINFKRNRTAIGLLSIFVSLVISFVITPMMNSELKKQTDIVIVSNTIKENELITDSKLQVIQVNKNNLPTNVAYSKDEVIGKYTNSELQKGDLIVLSKLEEKSQAKFDYLEDLDGEKMAMSITIKSFASGLSGKLESGDIVSLISANYDNLGVTEIPNELKYVKVLTATNDYGVDNNISERENGTDEENRPPITLTLLVNEQQAKLLADLEQKGNVHATLIFRGNETKAKQFLNVQDEYFVDEVEEDTNLQENVENIEVSNE